MTATSNGYLPHHHLTAARGRGAVVRLLSSRCISMALFTCLCLVLTSVYLLGSAERSTRTAPCDCDFVSNSHIKQKDTVKIQSEQRDGETGKTQSEVPKSLREFENMKRTAPIPVRNVDGAETAMVVNEDGGERTLAPGAHRLCVIVPYRDRFEELQVFVPYLDKFLTQQNIDHRLLVMNQYDEYRFNRAALINVGYYESKAVNCDYLCMHDVDLLPKNPMLDYRYPAKGSVYHVAAPQYHPRYSYKTFIGGILIVAMDDFRNVNGLSNRYWGWGLEDDEFYLRLKEADLEVRRPENLDTDKNSTFVHIHDKRIRKRDTVRLGEQKEVSRRRDRYSGLDNVKYEVLSRVKMQADSSSFTVINVKLHCDKKFSPWCQLPPSKTKKN